MKKLVLSLTLLFTVSLAYSQVNVLKVDYQEGLKMAKEQGKLLLVDCTTDGGWAPCIQVDKFYLPSKKTGDFINKHFIFLHYPSSHKENSRLEELFDVNCHPTFLIIDSDGKLLSKSTGAGDTEDKFITELAYCIDKNNFIDNKRKAFDNGKLSAVDYYEYCDKMGLRSEMSKVLNQIFIESKKAGKLDEFIKKYCNFDPMVYFNIVDSELYDFLAENEALIIKSGVKKDLYPLFISAPIESAIERMLCSGEYTEKELNKIIKLSSKTRSPDVIMIQVEAIKHAKVDGLKGIIGIYNKAIETMTEDDIFSLNLLLIRNYNHTVKTTPYMQEYIKKCIKRSPERGEKTYKNYLSNI